MSGATLFAHFLFAMGTAIAKGLLAAYPTTIHLRGQWFWFLASDSAMQIEEASKCDIVREGLDTVVRNAMLGPTLGTLDLPSSIVYQALHAGLAAKGVLTWQQLWIAKPVQTNGTGEQLFQLAPGRHLEAAVGQELEIVTQRFTSIDKW